MHRNTVYGHPEWAKHKSSWRHGRHLISIAASGVIGGIGPPVLLSTLSALFVTLINYGVMHHRFAIWVPRLQIASTPFTLIAPVLAFLLVFRTNSSYQRFDEARKAWGSNVNRCRDLARQSLTWIRFPGDAHKLDIILRYTKAYPFFLKHHLTKPLDGHNSIAEVVNILRHDEIESIRGAQNRPIYVLQVISEVINQCQLPNYERVAMDVNLTQFHDNVGACERIFKTPIPVAYTRLTSRMLILWHLALPYGLWEGCGWLTIPATFMSAAALFYIEQVGVLIEEPFWILALDSICGGITGAIDGLCIAHEEAAVMARGMMTKPANHLEQIRETPVEMVDMSESAPLVSPKEDQVMINFDRSKTLHHHGTRSAFGDVNVVFSRLKSVS